MLLKTVANDLAELKDGLVRDAIKNRIAFLPPRDQAGVLQGF
jgi:hypothetical protein